VIIEHILGTHLNSLENYTCMYSERRWKGNGKSRSTSGCMRRARRTKRSRTWPVCRSFASSAKKPPRNEKLSAPVSCYSVIAHIISRHFALFSQRAGRKGGADAEACRWRQQRQASLVPPATQFGFSSTRCLVRIEKLRCDEILMHLSFIF